MQDDNHGIIWHTRMDQGYIVLRCEAENEHFLEQRQKIEQQGFKIRHWAVLPHDSQRFFIEAIKGPLTLED